MVDGGDHRLGRAEQADEVGVFVELFAVCVDGVVVRGVFDVDFVGRDADDGA